mmetsp:Transcript_7321/g.12518  ORF Transcript_7321/g.12518 Transcript_7321/m.12518 type:complete len:202 (+) Transcript_7321:58-663(+)
MTAVDHGTLARTPAICCRFPSVIERYYVRFAQIDCAGQGHADQYVYRHSNGLCLVGLAPSHVAITGGNKIKSVQFVESRLNTQLRGKRKKGATFLEANTRLCTLDCDDGSTFTVITCIRGYLLEVNSRLLTEPHLLNSAAGSEGFIAILNPRKAESSTFTAHLLPFQKYLDHRQISDPEGPADVPVADLSDFVETEEALDE